MKKVVVAWSGGKDSTAMLLRLIELGERIDQIIFADTTYEYKELYDYMSLVSKKIGFKYDILKPEKDFLKNYSLEKVSRGNHKGKIRGLPLSYSPCWYMREAKKNPIDRFIGENVTVLIGYAYDEKHRFKQGNGVRAPLIEWGWTEADCADYLNKKGLFNPLYVNFNRSGCYWCPKQSKQALYATWKAYPEEWKKACELDQWSIKNIGRPIRADGTYDYWEEKFRRGYVPKAAPKYDCWSGCEGVKRAFLQSQKSISCFF